MRWEVFKTDKLDPTWYTRPEALPGLVAITSLTFMVTAVPLFFSQKKLKRLEILSIL